MELNTNQGYIHGCGKLQTFLGVLIEYNKEKRETIGLFLGALLRRFDILMAFSQLAGHPKIKF